MPDSSLPVVLPLPSDLAPEVAAQRARPAGGLLFLDSALRDARLGRYSYVASSPSGAIRFDKPAAALFDDLSRCLREFQNPDRSDLPPWQGGVAGYFGYELGQALERIPTTRWNDYPLPAAQFHIYDVVAAFDHLEQKAWVLSSGYPETDPAARLRRAQERAAYFCDLLLTDNAQATPPAPTKENIAASELAPQFDVEGAAGLVSNFSRDGYLKAVQRVIDYIHAGDAFQVNLSQRLLFPCQGDPFETYLRLRQRNPAPFAAYLDGGDYQIASASPERFLFARDGRIETRPIKGTRRRLASPEADLYRADELRASEKDRAENVMIVDLLRNDLSKICTDESVQVTELCRIETYAFVQHLVSTVVGVLRSDQTLAHAVKACFPGGSITGAPKVRAMQIISELEPTPRGPYCGALGYLGFNGAMDLNILIRTMTASRGQWQFPVGGGIVADSDPRSEYEETLTKALGLVRSLID